MYLSNFQDPWRARWEIEGKWWRTLAPREQMLVSEEGHSRVGHGVPTGEESIPRLLRPAFCLHFQLSFWGCSFKQVVPLNLMVPLRYTWAMERGRALGIRGLAWMPLLTALNKNCCLSCFPCTEKVLMWSTFLLKRSISGRFKRSGNHIYAHTPTHPHPHTHTPTHTQLSKNKFTKDFNKYCFKIPLRPG